MGLDFIEQWYLKNSKAEGGAAVKGGGVVAENAVVNEEKKIL